jgi:hypothetical protein
MNQERLAVLKRYQQALADQCGRPISVAEAAFLVIEGRAWQVDRTASRLEMLQTPTASLDRIRKRWAAEHTLTAAEWDVIAEYAQVATEAERLEPCRCQPLIPSRHSYLVLLDVFERLSQRGDDNASPRAWQYFINLDGDATDLRRLDDDDDQRHQAVLRQLAHLKDRLRVAEPWERPGNIGWCVRTAITKEGIDSVTLDHRLASYWPTLWGLAARGHWLRHRQPVRAIGTAAMDATRDPLNLPDTMCTAGLSLSFAPSRTNDFTTDIYFGATRRVGCRIDRYPDWAEFRAMLENASDQPWNGRYFFTVASAQESSRRTLWLKERRLSVDFSESEWCSLRDLVRQAWQSPELKPWLDELQQEYGEQG